MEFTAEEAVLRVGTAVVMQGLGEATDYCGTFTDEIREKGLGLATGLTVTLVGDKLISDNKKANTRTTGAVGVRNTKKAYSQPRLKSTYDPLIGKYREYVAY